MLINSTPNFNIYRFYAFNSLRNYSFVLVSKATQEGWIIDPWDGEEIYTWTQKNHIQSMSVLNTHQHPDHIRGNYFLIQKNIRIMRECPHLETWPLPGHTKEHVVYFLDDASEQHLFAGDTLFQAGVGNCKNGGDPHTLCESIQYLKQRLNEKVTLHVGHDYLKKNLEFVLHVDPQNKHALDWLEQVKVKEGHELPPSNWKQELLVNPFLRISETSIRQRLIELNPNLADKSLSDEMVFIELRKLRDQW
jgi:hydroxyacylglutathione hydrolase